MLITPVRGLERPEEGSLVVPPSAAGPGAWAGGPSALHVDGVYYLAYRLRMPLGQGRGFANVVARSHDGVHFEPVAELNKDRFGAESLERPALVHTEDGRWRLYVSCATPGTKHWRVDVVEAPTVEDLADPSRSTFCTVLAGSDTLAVKDPVIARRNGYWQLWASVHPLDDPQSTDRMRTDHATSPDGLDWTWHGVALEGRPDMWDVRGARISAVVFDEFDELAGAYYDGRATAEENWEERTGLALPVEGTSGNFAATDTQPIGQSPYGAHGLRYVSVVQLADRTMRLYYEMTRADGAHELRTCLQPSLFA